MIEEVNMLNVANASLMDESLLLEKTRQELINRFWTCVDTKINIISKK